MFWVCLAAKHCCLVCHWPCCGGWGGSTGFAVDGKTIPCLASCLLMVLLKTCFSGVMQFGFEGCSLSNAYSISYDWKFSSGIHHSSSQPTNLTLYSTLRWPSEVQQSMMSSKSYSASPKASTPTGVGISVPSGRLGSLSRSVPSLRVFLGEADSELNQGECGWMCQMQLTCVMTVLPLYTWYSSYLSSLRALTTWKGPM